MFKKLFILFLICLFSIQIGFAVETTSQDIVAKYSKEIPPRPDKDDDDGLSAGGIVGIAAGTTGGVGAAAGALAFTPLLLAGLSPSNILGAAAPITSLDNASCYLQKILTCNYDECEIEKILSEGKIKNKYYFPVNDREINDGFFDILSFDFPEELKKGSNIRFDMIVYSDPYSVADNKPEFQIELFKDITMENLRKKFETRQFLHKYFMSKYEIPMQILKGDYNQGVQILSGKILTEKIKNLDKPLQVVTRYTPNGFSSKIKNGKKLTYAYLLIMYKE